MSAKLNNVLDIGVPKDISYTPTISYTTTGTPNITTTGTETLIYDKSLTTNYEIVLTYTDLGSDSLNVKLDYGNMLWNVQLGFKLSEAFNTAGVGRGNLTIYYSIDDITYIELEQITGIHTGETILFSSYVVPACRYLKLAFNGGDGVPGNTLTCKIYEITFLGS